MSKKRKQGRRKKSREGKRTKKNREKRKKKKERENEENMKKKRRKNKKEKKGMYWPYCTTTTEGSGLPKCFSSEQLQSTLGPAFGWVTLAALEICMVAIQLALCMQFGTLCIQLSHQP